MISRIAIAIGAGLAAALLFYIPVKGSALAMILAIFAALPIMIAGLAFSPSVAFGAAVAGTAALLLALDEIFAATFALTSAFPAWWLTRLAWLARPATANGEPGATPDGLVWYPLGQLLAWITALAAAMSIAGVLMAWYRFGSYDAFLEEASRRMQPIIEAIFSRGASGMPAGLNADALARLFVLAMTPIFAAWTVVTMALNLWLAGRVARMSERGRPWINVPENLVLPRVTLYALAAGGILLLPEGFLRVTGTVILASIGMALMLQGLASLHYASRPSRVRSTMLTLLYVSIFILFPLPLPLLAVVGLVDMLMSIRKRSNLPPASGTQTT